MIYGHKIWKANFITLLVSRSISVVLLNIWTVKKCISFIILNSRIIVLRFRRKLVPDVVFGERRTVRVIALAGTPKRHRKLRTFSIFARWWLSRAGNFFLIYNAPVWFSTVGTFAHQENSLITPRLFLLLNVIVFQEKLIVV